MRKTKKKLYPKKRTNEFIALIIFLAIYFIENNFKVGKTFDKMA
jgi:hypothetical protein